MTGTIAYHVSRVRGVLKASKEDSFITDRFIYALLMKWAKLYIKRMDDQNKIMRFQSLFEVLPCVEMIDVDKVEACCGDIKSGCTFKRSKDRLPTILEGTYGPLFRTVSSIDGSIPLFRTYPQTFVQMSNTTNFKFNSKKYFWYLDGYVYSPNIEWDAIRMEVIPEDSIAMYKCVDDCCIKRQDEPTHIPEYLFAQIEGDVKADLLNTMQIPPDGKTDNQSLLRD